MSLELGGGKVSPDLVVSGSSSHHSQKKGGERIHSIKPCSFSGSSNAMVPPFPPFPFFLPPNQVQEATTNGSSALIPAGPFPAMGDFGFPTGPEDYDVADSQVIPSESINVGDILKSKMRSNYA